MHKMLLGVLFYAFCGMIFLSNSYTIITISMCNTQKDILLKHIK